MAPAILHSARAVTGRVEWGIQRLVAARATFVFFVSVGSESGTRERPKRRRALWIPGAPSCPLQHRVPLAPTDVGFGALAKISARPCVH